jgi:hypothetical protein
VPLWKVWETLAGTLAEEEVCIIHDILNRADLFECAFKRIVISPRRVVFVRNAEVSRLGNVVPHPETKHERVCRFHVVDKVTSRDRERVTKRMRTAPCS